MCSVFCRPEPESPDRLVLRSKPGFTAKSRTRGKTPWTPYSGSRNSVISWGEERNGRSESLRRSCATEGTCTARTHGSRTERRGSNCHRGRPARSHFETLSIPRRCLTYRIFRSRCHPFFCCIRAKFASFRSQGHPRSSPPVNSSLVQNPMGTRESCYWTPRRTTHAP